MTSAPDPSRWGSVDLALLILRIGIGTSFVLVYGLGKITGGPGTWANLGQNVALFGVTVWPAFWGFTDPCKSPRTVSRVSGGPSRT
jgi:putative oxidoreductase